MRRTSTAAAAAATLALGLVLTGCGGDEAQSTGAVASISNVDTGAGLPGIEGVHGTVDPIIARPAQQLKATDGTSFSLAERPTDELTVVFWGYTNCPDICPTTMADLARARDALPVEMRERVKVVFITEDPTRDDPAFLRTWLDRYDPEFTALIGGNPATEEMLTALHLPQTTGEPSDEHEGEHDGEHGTGHGSATGPVKGLGGEYLVDHTGVVYAFVPGSSGAVVYTGGVTIEQYTADFLSLLA
ncbi:MAG: SCO family protein [Sporichthyaceae bacterium]